MSNNARSNHSDFNESDLKRFEIATRLDLNEVIKKRRRRRLREASFPSRMLRNRPNVRLDRELLDTVRTVVHGEPDLKLQDAFDEALTLWLTVRACNAAGMSLLATPMRLQTLAI